MLRRTRCTTLLKNSQRHSFTFWVHDTRPNILPIFFFLNSSCYPNQPSLFTLALKKVNEIWSRWIMISVKREAAELTHEYVYVYVYNDRRVFQETNELSSFTSRGLCGPRSGGVTSVATCWAPGPGPALITSSTRVERMLFV